MGRGVSAGGGQSSLGYLFGSGEAPKPAVNNAPAGTQPPLSTTQPKAVAPKPVDITNQGPAGLNSNSANNYMRADGQNSGNFLTVCFLLCFFFFQKNGVTTDTIMRLCVNLIIF